MPQPTTPVACITGAGSGIGRAVARRLGDLGYALALVGRREEPLRETAALLPASAPNLILSADVSDTRAIGAAIDRTVEHFGRLDALVNNAGAAPLAPIDRTTPELLEECFRVNTLGPAAAIARAWPTFKAQRAGCIVNVSSMATADPFPGFFAYAAAKAGVNLMARSCAKEGKAFNIRAFAVAPGAVDTPMLRANFNEKTIPPSRCLSPDDVATVIVECIRGDRNACNGDTIFVPSP